MKPRRTFGIFAPSQPMPRLVLCPTANATEIVAVSSPDRMDDAFTTVRNLLARKCPKLYRK